MKLDDQQLADDTAPSSAGNRESLLNEWVAHVRQRRAPLREQWARRLREANLLKAMSEAESFSEATSFYDNYVKVLETGSVEALQAYAQSLSQRIIPREIETHELLGIALLLRDVLARSLLEKYHNDFERLNQALDAFEPATNRIASTMAASFVAERERIIGQQQKAMRTSRIQRLAPWLHSTCTGLA